MGALPQVSIGRPQNRKRFGADPRPARSKGRDVAPMPWVETLVMLIVSPIAWGGALWFNIWMLGEIGAWMSAPPLDPEDPRWPHS